MSRKMSKIIFANCLLFSVITAQVPYSGRFLQKPTLLVFAVAVILVLVFYAKYLYSNNNKLNKHKDRLSRINSELQAKVIKKEHRARVAENTLKVISDNTFDAIIILDSFGRITFWNTAAERLFGHSQNDVLNCDFINKVIPGNEANSVREKYNFNKDREIVQSEKIIHVNAQKIDGIQFPAEIKISNIRYEDDYNTVCVIRDSSDNKTLEKELLLSERQLLLSINDKEANKWEWNLQTDEMYIGAKARDMLGYEKKAFYTRFKPWLNSIHPADQKSLINEFEKIKQKRVSIVRVEYREKTGYGAWNWISTRGKIIEYDDSGNPLKFVGINSDINEQKIYEYELDKIQDKVFSTQILN